MSFPWAPGVHPSYRWEHPCREWMNWDDAGTAQRGRVTHTPPPPCTQHTCRGGTEGAGCQQLESHDLGTKGISAPRASSLTRPCDLRPHPEMGSFCLGGGWHGRCSPLPGEFPQAASGVLIHMKILTQHLTHSPQKCQLLLL